MVIIKSVNYIGEGAFRTCFVHPENTSKCIKVYKRNLLKGTNDYRELKRELAYYKVLEKKDVSWHGIPRYYGVVKTNLGDGYVFDLICDHNGVVSKTLEYYINHGIPDYLEVSLRELHNYLVDHAIITRVIQPRNIVLQKKSCGKVNAIVIDDILNNEFIPLSNYSQFIARRKVTRRFKRFLVELRKYDIFIDL